MSRHKLANVLLEDCWQFYRTPAIYCNSDAPVTPPRGYQSTWALVGPGIFDFTTFFNALSTSKWLRYTKAQNFFLHLELRGAACTYVQTRADSYTWTAEQLNETERTIPANDAWTILDIPLQLNNDVLVGFLLKAQGEIFIRNSFYYTELEEDSIETVELALCTTTFKNEDYILPNIELIKKRIIQTVETIAQHFTLHVVDNGRTLDASALEEDRIHVHPNPNAGGAGGFARGMIEAMEQEPRATHVLLMDDDVNVSPESILRSYSLLQIVNDEYREAFLSGAMMSLDVPNIRFEDVGFVASEGKYFPMKREAYVDTLHDCVVSEAYLIPDVDEPYMADRATQAYAAWWYCVIPMTVIEKNGMPLPVFVRTDDVEYSLRAQAKLMTMNGICVWHSPFGKRYSATVERYQMTRNVLIGRYASGMAPMSDFIGSIERAFELELKKFNYANAELVLDGFEDFLKGPSFIAEPGAAEAAYLAHLKSAEQLVPLEDLHEQALELGVNLDDISTLSFDDEDFDVDHRGFRNRFEDNMSVNGHKFIHNRYTQPGSVGIIHASGWLYPVDRIRKKEYLIAIDPVSKKGAIRKINLERFKQLEDRFHRDMLEYRTNKDRLKQEYEAARPALTSVAFWKNYLGIE